MPLNLPLKSLALRTLHLVTLSPCHLVILLLALACPACSKPASPAAGKPTAVATIFAYYDALRSIGGPDINAIILLPPGTSPHDFAPTPKDKESVDNAKLIIKNGLGLDDWILKLAASNKSALTLSLGDDLEAIQTHEELLPGQTPESDKALGDLNPHVWLDPVNQARAANKIRDALIQLVPARKPAFEARAAAYLDDLKKLDADFQSASAKFKHHEFIGFHSAYDYLARRYGLTQVAAIQEIGPGGLNPAQIERVEKLILQKHIPVVFTESAFDTRQADVVVKATGVKLGILQPLETYDSLQDTYSSLMRQNLQSLKDALGG